MSIRAQAEHAAAALPPRRASVSAATAWMRSKSTPIGTDTTVLDRPALQHARRLASTSASSSSPTATRKLRRSRSSWNATSRWRAGRRDLAAHRTDAQPIRLGQGMCQKRAVCASGRRSRSRPRPAPRDSRSGRPATPAWRARPRWRRRTLRVDVLVGLPVGLHGTSAARPRGGTAARGLRWRTLVYARISAPRTTAAERLRGSSGGTATCPRVDDDSIRFSAAWAIYTPPRSRISASSATATPPAAAVATMRPSACVTVQVGLTIGDDDQRPRRPGPVSPARQEPIAEQQRPDQLVDGDQRDDEGLHGGAPFPEL